MRGVGGDSTPFARNPIGVLEVALDVRDELTVRRMIRRFDAYDSRLEPRLLLMEIPQKMELCGRRPDDENSFGRLENTRNVGEKVTFVVGVLVRARPPLWMAMNVMLGGGDNRFVDVGRADAEDACLVMIDPHGGTWMKSHSNVLRRYDAHVYGDDGSCLGSRANGDDGRLELPLCALVRARMAWLGDEWPHVVDAQELHRLTPGHDGHRYAAAGLRPLPGHIEGLESG